MDEIIILNKDTYRYMMETFKQIHRWLEVDARFAHPESHVKAVESNVKNSLRLINTDVDKYKENCKILIEELNKKAESCEK